MRKIKPIILILQFVVVFSSHAQVQLNSDFEFSYSPCYFKNWYFNADRSYVATVDTVNAFSGKKCLFVYRNDTRPANKHFFFYNTDTFPRSFFKNKKTVIISAYVKGDSIAPGSYATLYANIRGNDKFKYEQSDHYTIKSGKNWKHLTITLPVHEWATSLLFGGIVQGSGKFWFDRFEVSIDGNPVTDNAFFLDSPSDKQVKWMNNHLIEIKGDGNSFIIDDKIYKQLQPGSIIALGEATHGTHEFSILKNDIIRDIATRRNGKIVVAFESSFGTAITVNDYITNGTGNPEKILNNISNPWRTKEVLDLLTWIKNFNASSENKIIFSGIDLSWLSAETQVLLDYVEKYDSSLVTKVGKLHEMSSRIMWPNTQKAELDSLKTELSEIEQLLTEKPEAASMSFSIAIHSIDIMYQFIEKNSNPVNMYIRDSCMAENVNWLRAKYPDRLIIVWAHNGHIMNMDGRMGYHLKKRHNDDYKSIGLFTSFGTYSVFDNGSEVVPLHLPHPETYEYWFDKQRYNNWLLNLALLDSDNKNNWLKTPRMIRSRGYAWGPTQFGAIGTIVNKFDLLIYLENTRHIDFIGLRQ